MESKQKQQYKSNEDMQVQLPTPQAQVDAFSKYSDAIRLKTILPRMTHSI